MRSPHAGLEDEVVVPSQDRERIELHRPEVPEHLADPVLARGVARSVQSDGGKLVEARLFPRPGQGHASTLAGTRESGQPRSVHCWRW